MDVKIYINSTINSKLFEKRVSDVMDQLGLQAEFISVDHSKASSQHPFYTPALYIDGNLISSGKVLSKEEILKCFL
ncbi:hypothetical protein CR194_10600 [Salipaludibacillus keqinensis]|uniref:Thioredoxin-like fold domain-containing protein n=1 Tax=Salipaludibacillus keqinensis TaxID=2045207 RepID=A0A323TLX7_9BACI|nr:hypothetical protein CR194_10600 [Salipaludibacillus keqinensis]